MFGYKCTVYATELRDLCDQAPALYYYGIRKSGRNVASISSVVVPVVPAPRQEAMQGLSIRNTATPENK